MWAIQFLDEDKNEWRTCIRDLHTGTLQVFLLEDEAKKEFKTYKRHAFEHRLVKVQILPL